MKGYVLQPWCENIGWKMQSILQSGFLGPDRANVPNIKAVNRWLRSVSQHNADPSKDYMKKAPLPTYMELCDELEYCTCHYTHHMADALRVIAIYHTVPDVRDIAYTYHFRIAEELFHFRPESDVEFISRHRDKVE